MTNNVNNLTDTQAQPMRASSEWHIMDETLVYGIIVTSRC